jgi:hypothetical protein
MRTGCLGGDKKGMHALIIAAAGTRFCGRVALGRMGGAEDAVLAQAIDDGVTLEGVVTAFLVFHKLELTMTHAAAFRGVTSRGHLRF